AAEDPTIGDRQSLVVEEDGGRDQRPGQAATPGLVGARDEAVVEPAIEVEESLAAAQPPFVKFAAAHEGNGPTSLTSPARRRVTTRPEAAPPSLQRADAIRRPVGREGLADDPFLRDGAPV